MLHLHNQKFDTDVDAVLSYELDPLTIHLFSSSEDAESCCRRISNSASSLVVSDER